MNVLISKTKIMSVQKSPKRVYGIIAKIHVHDMMSKTVGFFNFFFIIIIFLT